MVSIKACLAGALVLLTGCGATVPSPLPQQQSPLGPAVTVRNDILVRLKSQADLTQVTQNMSLAKSPVLLSQSKHLYRLQLKANTSFSSAIQQLQQDPHVMYAEPNSDLALVPYQVRDSDFKVAYQPNDANYGLQWNMKSSKIDQAWALTRSNKKIIVGVIDSGVDPNHPDLQPHLLPMEDIWSEMEGADLLSTGGKTINFGGKDGNGHGTHTTGVIGAVMNNRQGVAGVAGEGIKILPIKATDNTGNTNAAVLTAAFQRAIDKGVNVINISIGGPKDKGTQAFIDVIRLAVSKNITIVSATSNESSRFDNLITPVYVPAAYPEVIGVGAHTEFDKVASYSNGGPEIDLVAPGGGGLDLKRGEGAQIWSTWPTYPTQQFYAKRILSTSYAATSGTSMACPHVAGVVALMLSREPSLTPQQIRGRLIATADDIDVPGFDESTGYGKMNALRALQWTQHDFRD